MSCGPLPGAVRASWLFWMAQAPVRMVQLEPGGPSARVESSEARVPETRNVAVQFVSAFMTGWPLAHAASPLHPANADPEAGVAVSVTGVPLGYSCAQSGPQLMPAGAL